MFVIWFLFDKLDHEYISKIIKKLSQKYNSPFFIPHLTSHGIIKEGIEEIDKVILDSIKGVKPFSIEKNKISFSDDFWKTLFIDISSNKELEKINKKLKENLPLVQKYDFNPHISLIYKNLEINEKKKLVKKLTIKYIFKISKLSIQEYSENIKKWKIIKEYSLQEF